MKCKLCSSPLFHRSQDTCPSTIHDLSGIAALGEDQSRAQDDLYRNENISSDRHKHDDAVLSIGESLIIRMHDGVILVNNIIIIIIIIIMGKEVTTFDSFHQLKEVIVNAMTISKA
jgi:hypothetical protein